MHIYKHDDRAQWRKIKRSTRGKCKYKLADGHFGTYVSITKRTGVVKINTTTGQHNQLT